MILVDVARFSEVTNSDQELLDAISSTIVDYFAPRSIIGRDFQATWAFIVTWANVVGRGFDAGVQVQNHNTCL